MSFGNVTVIKLRTVIERSAIGELKCDNGTVELVCSTRTIAMSPLHVLVQGELVLPITVQLKILSPTFHFDWVKKVWIIFISGLNFNVNLQVCTVPLFQSLLEVFQINFNQFTLSALFLIN